MTPAPGSPIIFVIRSLLVSVLESGIQRVNELWLLFDANVKLYVKQVSPSLAPPHFGEAKLTAMRSLMQL